MSITALKCPCCGAELTFSASTQNMTCEYCGTEMDVEAVKASQTEEGSEEIADWGEYREEQLEMDSNGLCTYSCDNCGAQITGDKTLGASSCPYCGSPFTVKETFSGMLKPDFVIPFKITKEQAKDALKKFCGKKILLPGDFMSSHRIETIQGMYVPYWLFGCGSESKIVYSAQRSTSWTEGQYRVTRTDHYRIVRAGGLSFSDVPVDGIKKLDNDITEAVEPFDTAQGVEFNPAYLSGFCADKYDVSAAECEPRANERIRKTIKDAFRNTVSGYALVTEISTNIKLKDTKVRYGLMPMWLLTAKYNGKLYTFAMNGQNGRFVGTLPISVKRFIACTLGIAAASFGLIFAICSMAGL